jgi:hypothetical protein
MACASLAIDQGYASRCWHRPSNPYGHHRNFLRDLSALLSSRLCYRACADRGPSSEGWRNWVLHVSDRDGEEIFAMPFAAAHISGGHQSAAQAPVRSRLFHQLHAFRRARQRLVDLDQLREAFAIKSDHCACDGRGEMWTGEMAPELGQSEIAKDVDKRQTLCRADRRLSPPRHTLGRAGRPRAPCPSLRAEGSNLYGVESGAGRGRHLVGWMHRRCIKHSG